MARTYGRIHVHLVWATKNREPIIGPEWRNRLHSYVGGIVRRCGGTLFEMGGIEDHVHLYLECPTTLSISTLVGKIKANSSRWIHHSFADHENFRWQRGYAVFSVDPKRDCQLRQYIQNQEAHHRSKSFDHEYIALLRSYDLEEDGDAFD